MSWWYHDHDHDHDHHHHRSISIPRIINSYMFSKFPILRSSFPLENWAFFGSISGQTDWSRPAQRFPPHRPQPGLTLPRMSHFSSTTKLNITTSMVKWRVKLVIFESGSAQLKIVPKLLNVFHNILYVYAPLVWFLLVKPFHMSLVEQINTKWFLSGWIGPFL